MLTSAGHLTYCTNIHPGDDWSSHFLALKENFPLIKNELSPSAPMGIGLRVSYQASKELSGSAKLEEFKDWLIQEDAYVFTINGFPYGEFHHTEVKDHVHSPDWTTPKRLSYTLDLVTILSRLLPEEMDGGISTSPLSYRYWFENEEEREKAMHASTRNIIEVVEQMKRVKESTSKVLHLDIEPEPDGLLETGAEFMDWYENYLLPIGKLDLSNKLGISASDAENIIKEHVRLCYDVCHFALGYENHATVIKQLAVKGIKIGKLQISAALKAALPERMEDRSSFKAAFSSYNEPIYLHQVIALKDNGALLRYRDLPDALEDMDNMDVKEWRAHFHVPIFENDFGILQSTQADIIEVLTIQEELQLTKHLEVETYTWGVLPTELKLPIHQSIVRELRWVLPLLEKGF